MRTERRTRPRWRSLNLILLAGFGLFILVAKLHLSLADHELALIGAVAVLYLLMASWASNNAAGLADEDSGDTRAGPPNASSFVETLSVPAPGPDLRAAVAEPRSGDR